METVVNYTAYKMTRHQAVACIFTIAMLCFYILSQQGTKGYETNMHAIRKGVFYAPSHLHS